MLALNQAPNHIQDEINAICESDDYGLSPTGFFERIQRSLITCPPQRLSAIYNIPEALCAEIMTLSDDDKPTTMLLGA